MIRFGAALFTAAALILAASLDTAGAVRSGQSLLVNGDFSDWRQDQPADWRWRDTPPVARILAEEKADAPIMSITRPNAMYQDVASLPIRKDDRIVFEGYLRTGEDDMAFLDITMDFAGRGEREVMRSFVPSGGWQYMRLVLRAPMDDPEVIRFAIHMRDEMQSPLLVSGLRASVIPGMP